MQRLKTWTLRVVAGLLGLIVLLALALWLFLRASLAQLDGTHSAPGMIGTVKVERDARGVPAISGANRLDIAYATGFVHAQDRFFQMDLLRRVAGGELAELFGAKALPLDKGHRLHRFRARAEQMIAAMPPQDRQFLERYVAGVNDGLDSLSARPFEYALIGVKPRAWMPADSLLVVWAMYFDLQGSQEARELSRGWLRDHASAEQLAFLLPEATQWDAPLDAQDVAAPAMPIPAAPPAWWGKPRGAEVKVAQLDFAADIGSNNWAVAGSRSKDGGAIVSDDMHLGIQLPNTWYRLALQFPDEKGVQHRIVGVTLPGAPPVVVVGSNGHVAWGFTNSYGDYMDLVALDADAVKAAVEKRETILVKDAKAVDLVVRETPLGPLREVDGKTYAIHWTAHQPNSLNMNPRKLELASSLNEALDIATTMGIPSQNFMAGDDQGNIGWTIAGLLPKRAAYGAQSTFPMLASEPAANWQGSLATADYPRVVNPASGQLATANSRQLMGAGGAIIGDGGFDLGARAHQVRDDLSALGPKTDVKGAYGVTMDDRALFLAPWRERALKALDDAAVDKQPLRAQFRALLKDSWSGHASADSVGYRLTRAFMWQTQDLLFSAANGEMAKIDGKAGMASASARWPVVLARLIDEQPAAWLPPDYKSWQQVQLVAIDKVIAELVKDGKALSNATWGARNAASISHPIGNAVPFLHTWLAAPADQLPGDSHMPRVAGQTFGQSERLTVTPGKEEQGIFNMPGGQSGHPLSPFFLAGHAEWVSGTPAPLLPGTPVHTLTFVR
ncbi:MAG: penicillin acylase family protein [Pseudomonadota bacterium]